MAMSQARQAAGGGTQGTKARWSGLEAGRLPNEAVQPALSEQSTKLHEFSMSI